MQLHSLTAFVVLICCFTMRSNAVEIFGQSQTFTLIENGEVWDTYSSNGYIFTATRDKLFTGGLPGGEPIGRSLDVELPIGLEAQALSVVPLGINDNKAKIVISREDGMPFDLNAFTMEMLWNQTNPITTLFEIMPIFNDEDAFVEPIRFNGTGHYGDLFHYDQFSAPTNTSMFENYHAYKIKFLLDFAMVSLVVQGPACPPDLNGDGMLNFFDISAFLTAFANADPSADFSGDGLFNFFDISSFLQAFAAGCP